MNKLLFIIKSLVVIALIAMYVIFFSKVGFNSVPNFIIMLLIIAIQIICISGIRKKYKGFNYNNVNNIISILVYLVIIMLLWRTMYDPNIMYNYLASQAGDTMKAQFYNNNVTYILVMITSLFIYNIVSYKENKVLK